MAREMQQQKKKDEGPWGRDRSEDLCEIRTAVISVADKTGLVEFAKGLESFGVSLLATGGTYSTLTGAGVRVRSLQEAMGLSEALSGRVKTLHANLFAGILAKRTADHLSELRSMRVDPLDMVVCNFYPFEKVALEPGSSEESVIENIDIGGPSMVRASSKNFRYVTVVPSPTCYAAVLEELGRNDGKVGLALRQKLAVEAFSMTASYDAVIYNELRGRLPKREEREPLPLPERRFLLSASRYREAKYGENPDQQATIYSIDGARKTMASWEQLAGDSLSFNNYLDIGSAYDILEGFEAVPAAATVKHGQISGFALAPTAGEAYALAHACDPEADFGGTVILNTRVDADAARLIGKNEERDASVYTEIVIAPDFTPEALAILNAKQKKKMRLIRVTGRPDYPYDIKEIEGAILAQQSVDYRKKLDASKLTFPTKTKPSGETLQKMLAAWELVRRVQSNGIVLAEGSGGASLTRFWTLGVASFRKRNGAVKIALENAGSRAKGAVCASDGFFPFRDNIDYLGKAGVSAVIQPGGSISDDEVIEAADEYSMSMAFTHTRAFKH